MRSQAQLIMVITDTTCGGVLFSTRCTFSLENAKCLLILANIGYFLASFHPLWCPFTCINSPRGGVPKLTNIRYGRNVAWWPGWMLVDACTHTGPHLVTAHTLTCHHSFSCPDNNIFLLIPRNIFNLVKEAYLQGGKL